MLNPSGHFGTYTTDCRSIELKLGSRAWLTKERIHFTEGIIYQGEELTRFVE
jgi:hypothetical protein